MKAPCHHIVMMAGIFLLTTLQISTAIPDTETKITLESAVETALRENPGLGAIRKKIEAARAPTEWHRITRQSSTGNRIRRRYT